MAPYMAQEAMPLQYVLHPTCPIENFAEPWGVLKGSVCNAVESNTPYIPCVLSAVLAPSHLFLWMASYAMTVFKPSFNLLSISF